MAVGEVAGFGGGVLVVVKLCRLGFMDVSLLLLLWLFPALTGCAWGRVYGVAYRLVRSRHIVRALAGSGCVDSLLIW